MKVPVACSNLLIMCPKEIDDYCALRFIYEAEPRAGKGLEADIAKHRVEKEAIGNAKCQCMQP